MKKISLFSDTCKKLSIILISFVSVITILFFILSRGTNIAADIFISLVLLVFLYVFLVINYSKIILDDEKVTFKLILWFKPKKYLIALNDLVEISLDKKAEEINVITVISRTEAFKFTGFYSLRGYPHNLEVSSQIVDNLNNYIK